SAERGVHEPGARVIALSLVLAGRPRWTGTVDALAVRLRGAAPRVLSARIAGNAFTPGWEPLGEELADPAEPTSGDCGLVHQGARCRRAWPTQLGVPLFAEVAVPAGGVLSVDLGKRVADPVVFEVARADGARFVTLAERAHASSTWEPLAVDLSAFA